MNPYLSRKIIDTKLLLLTVLSIASLLQTINASAQDSIVVLGRVNSSGSLLNSANTVDGTVTSTRSVEGSYVVTVQSPGAFADSTGANYIVECTIVSTHSNDEIIKADVATSDDQLTVGFQVVDAEDSDDTSASEPSDSSFHFAVYRIAESGRISPSSRFVMAAGKVDIFGNLENHVGIEGVSVSSEFIETGEYEIILEKEGAFVGDTNTDYVLILTPFGQNTDDEILRGTGPSFVESFSNNRAVFHIFSDDLQQESDDDETIRTATPFYFTIYRIPEVSNLHPADSKLLVGLARLNGVGAAVGTASSLPNGTVTSERNGVGEYSVFINSPGAFAGKTGANFLVHASPIASLIFPDTIINPAATVVDNNTLEILVQVVDVEEAGQGTGVPVDLGAHISVYEASGAIQPDLRVGTKRNLSKMKGNDRYNGSGNGQQVRLKLPRTSMRKFYFALENDGNIADRIRLRESGTGNKLRTKYFRLTGGRKNVTAKITRTGHIEDQVLPDRFVRFQARAGYRKLNKRPSKKIRIKARSLYQGSRRDTNRVKTVGK